MKRILILGASGLLGRFVSENLTSEGGEFDVICQTRQVDLAFYEILDPINPSDLFSALDQLKPNVIINLIAYTDVNGCQINFNDAYLINTHLVENLALWLQKNAPKTHLIQISTDHIYEGVGYKSEEECSIVNMYAFSKYAAELALRGLGAVTILRTNFFGRSHTPGRKSFSDWIFDSLKSEMRIRLATDLYFNPVTLKFLANVIKECIRHSIFGIFNIGSQGGMSKYEFGIIFAKNLGLDVSLIDECKSKDIGFKVVRPFDMRMNVRKAEGVLGELPSLTDFIIQEKEEYESI
ncbi:SDR family oxidoreductase [Polynucleobacter paneuropaeus]|jgi:dTDP-4-dehydrorhamnose reductase|nr:SDR family oxidoreductase [Polynucleobacter paneuropaeus]